jgi:hypothetical protein
MKFNYQRSIGSISLKRIIALCGVCATATVFGQTSPDTAMLTWTGPGSDIDYITNWGIAAPNQTIPTLTTLQWNGVEAGNLNLTYNAGVLASGSEGNGYNIRITSLQTGSVTINTTDGTSSPLAISDIQIDTNGGAFTLGGPLQRAQRAHRLQFGVDRKAGRLRSHSYQQFDQPGHHWAKCLF